jgi:hypothetical protein
MTAVTYRRFECYKYWNPNGKLTLYEISKYSRRLATMGSSQATGLRYGSGPDGGDKLRNVGVSCVLRIDVIVLPRRFLCEKASHRLVGNR